jgi:hypothetical protein
MAPGGRSVGVSSSRNRFFRQLGPGQRFTRPRVERLEQRLPLAGVFFENFSSDLAPAAPGFDSWDTDPNTPQPDVVRILNDLPISAALQGHMPEGYFNVHAGQPGDSGWGLLADGHVLTVLSFGGEAAVIFSLPSAANGGGLAAGEEIAGVGLSVQGIGIVEAVGVNGTLTTPFNTGRAWERVAADRDDLLPSGLELGAISHLRVFAYLESQMSLDEVAVQISGSEANQPPLAADDTLIVDRRFGDSVVFYPLTNDFDPNGDAFEIVSHTQPQRGTLDELFGGFRYRASQEFLDHPTIREDSFEYTIRDSQGATAKAKVYFVLNHRPLGEAATYEQPHGATGSFGIAAPGLHEQLHDSDGDALTLRVAIAPEQGGVVIRPDGSFTYTPAAPDGRVNPDMFWFVASDGYEDSALVRVDVRHANAAPSVTDQVIHVDHGTPGPFQGVLRLGDPDGDLLDLSILDPAPDPSHVFFRTQHGTFILNGGQLPVGLSGDVEFDYYPQSGDLRGSDQFTFRVTDGFGASATATLEIRVPNYPPEIVVPGGHLTLIQEGGLSLARPSGSGPATGDLFEFRNRTAFSVLETTQAVFNDRQILAIDLDHDPLVAVLANPPTHGDVVLNHDGTFTYTPDAGAGLFGTDTFSYRVSDGFALSSNVIYVTIRQTFGDGLARSDLFHTEDDDRQGEFGHKPDTLVIDPRSLVANDSLSSGWVPAFVIRGLELSEGNNLRAFFGEDIDEPMGEITAENPYVPFDQLFFLDPTTEVDPGFSTFRSIRYRFLYSPPGFPESVQWSELQASSWATIVVGIFDELQGDADGVYDVIERDFLSDGDLNNDGVADHVQPHVATLTTNPFTHTHVDNWVTLVSSGQTTLADVHPAENPGAPPPLSAQYPIGFLDFQVVGLGAGEATTVTWIPHELVYVNSYYKYGREPEDDLSTPNLNEAFESHWYEFLYDGTTGAEFVQEFIPNLGHIVTRRIIVHFVDGARGDLDLEANGIIRDPGGPAMSLLAPRVAGVVINDGLAGGNSAQRSMVNSLAISFSDQVTIGKNAFELRRVGASKAVDLKIATSIEGGDTVARLTFKNGRDITAGSLRDGTYRLTIRGERVRDSAGNLLDGDGDGLAGGNRVDEFFRRFGDTDGDGDLDLADKQIFQSAYGKRRGQAGYLWYLDANANGKVWKEDLALFALGYCRSR